MSPELLDFSGGSRISRWGAGAADLRHGHFSVETKESGPIAGRARAGGAPPPGSANDYNSFVLKNYKKWYIVLLRRIACLKLRNCGQLFIPYL